MKPTPQNSDFLIRARRGRDHFRKSEGTNSENFGLSQSIVVGLNSRKGPSCTNNY